MDEIRALQINNIELRTELRLAKQHLQQAQETVTFLADLCAKQNDGAADRDAPRLRKELEERDALIFQLKLELRDLSDQSSNKYQLGNEAYEQPRAKVEEGHDKPKSVSDLLCGDGDDDGRENELNTHVLNPAITEFKPRHQAVEVIGEMAAAVGARTCDDKQQAWSGTAYEQVYFSTIDHNHLMGLAVYLEDMDEDEQRKCFLSLSKRDSKHLPIEWRWYWEETVRPAFLARMAVKDEQKEVLAEAETTSKGHSKNELDVSANVAISVHPIPSIAKSRYAQESTTDVYNTVGWTKNEGKSRVQDNEMHSARVLNAPGFSGHIPDRPNFLRDERDIFYRRGDPDPKLYRTVIISNIAPGITLSEILDKVVLATPKLCANFITKATFMDTEHFKLRDGTAMRMNAAMVVFVSASNAIAFVSACKNKRLTFCPPYYGLNVRTKVELVSTPTQPARFDVDDIREGRIGRKLYINDKGKFEPRDVVIEINVFARKGICDPMPYPLKYFRDGDAVIVLEYAGIEYARIAKRILDTNYRFFQGVENGYLA